MDNIETDGYYHFKMSVEFANLRPAAAKEIVPDSIHPGPAGSLVMAGTLVQAWGFEPDVSSVHVNVATNTATGERTKLSNFKGAAWDQLDESLPLPLAFETTAEHLAWKVSGLQDRINGSLLAVEGLTPGLYRLAIDNKAVTTFSADEWSKGENIGDFLTPMHDQALKVLELVTQRSDLDFFRWRTLQREHSDLKATSEAIKALDRMEEELQAAEHKAAQPVVHHYELKKV